MKNYDKRTSQRLDDHLIVTTSWDDGSKSDIVLSKLLSKYFLKGTFYITKSYNWRERPLSNDEIIEISEKQEIGAHTLTHPILNSLGEREASKEILGSKEYLESIVDNDVKAFCYPGGIYNDKVVELVKDAGFKGARTCKFGNFNIPNDPFRSTITLVAQSKKSTILSLKILMTNRLSISTIGDWEIRAKEAFDLFLNQGGIFHIYGHASLFEKYNRWNKLENVFSYISNRDGVNYMTNGEIFQNIG